MNTTHQPEQISATPSPATDGLSSLKPTDQLKLRITGLAYDLIGRNPEGVTQALSNKVSEILLDKLGIPAENEKVLGQEDACKLLRQAHGALNALKSEFNGQTPTADKDFRKSTMAQLEGVLKELAPPKPAIKEEISHGAKAADYELTKRIDEAAALTREGYLDFLKDNLSPRSRTIWNAFNLIGAIEKLSYQHPDWFNDHKAAPLVASLLSDKLLSVSKQEGLAITEKSFRVLCRSIDTVAAVFERQFIKNPEKESALFTAAARLTACATPGNPPGTIDYRFFWPLKEITSAYLSPEGGAALCAYFDEVHQVAGKVKGAEKLSTIDSAFRSLKGVTCWADTPQNQEHLRSILVGLNERLAKNREPFTSEALGGILSGLRGIDGEKLAGPVQRELAKTLLLVSDRVSKREEVPSLEALCKAIHGVAPSLGATTDPLKVAVSSLMGEFLRRLPEAPQNMSELGYACGALNELVPHVKRFPKLATALCRDVVLKVNYRTFAWYAESEKDLMASSVVQQAHFYYGIPIAPALEHILTALTPNAIRLANEAVSKSETRVAHILRGIEGVSVGRKVLRNGFESDIMLTFVGGPAIWGVEVDSPKHLTPGETQKDAREDAALAKMGIPVVRLPSGVSRAEVLAVIQRIRNGPVPTK